ncbi:hypothetical protein [Parasedimentitalea maritima]|uniref:Uncharacterized protein n=1 Tax=Parasedimentitalea maritima TaxID=2578117 RepID=A0A6A4RBF4_9RHOB|nr:hypothetical protein [Zongyanglinia marina]KAE9627822.1 hypothetical protein GP644_17110 [Zongyanglinia marina]
MSDTAGASSMTEAQARKVDAEIAKLMAETAKINTENCWYVAVVASGATLAIVAIVKLFM